MTWIWMLWNDVGYLVLWDICWYKLFGLLSKLVASLMRNYFPKRPRGAPLNTLSKYYDVPVDFVTTPPILRLYVALFAVAEGWLLLDIGWFVLFLDNPPLTLARTLLNYHVLGTSTASVFLSNDHSLYAPIYLGWTSCLILFALDQLTCQERVESDKIQNEKILAHSGTRTHNSEF